MSEIPENERVEQAPEDTKYKVVAKSGNGGIWGGVILIFLGVIFLFQQVGNFSFRNWWAVFILIPVLSSVGAAWQVFRSRGRFMHPGVIGPLYGAGYPFIVAMIFLFELDWGIWWPLFVVWGGLGMLASGFGIRLSDEHRERLSGRAVRPWFGWIGLGALLLGLTFIGYNLGLINPRDYLVNWWAVFIFSPVVGGLISTIRLVGARGGFGPMAILSLAATLVIAAVAVIAISGISWNLITPIILIAGGVLALLVAILRPNQSG